MLRGEIIQIPAGQYYRSSVQFSFILKTNRQTAVSRTVNKNMHIYADQVSVTIMLY